MERHRPRTMLEYLLLYSAFFCVLNALGLIALKIFKSEAISKDRIAIALGVPAFLSVCIGIFYIYKRKFGDEKDTEALETAEVKKESFDDLWNKK